MQSARIKPTVSPDWIVRIAQSLAGLVDLRAAVAAMSEELKPLIPHDHIDVALLTETGDDLIVYETGLETSWGKTGGRVEFSPIRDVLSGNIDHMIFADALRDHRVRFRGADTGPIQQFGLRSRLHHKIEISGDTIGALSVSSLRADVYSNVHLDAISTVANVVGPYFFALRASDIAKSKAIELERQQALRAEAEHLIEVQEQERSRIGMDLHDHFLADMSRLLRTLDDRGLPDQAKLDEARSSLSAAIRDVRGIVEDARPTLLEMFGLGTAIEAYLLNATKGTGIRARLSSDPEDLDALAEFDQREKLLVFRIVQEAVNNAVAHAQASEIVITFGQFADTFSISVEDDGTGISTNGRVMASGFQNMKARAVMMGATLRIGKPQVGAGTQVKLTLRQPKETR